MTTLSEISGVITSPFYPRYYSDNQSCSWEIRARKGKLIVLSIEDMSWSCDEVTWSCACGYVEIHGGSLSAYDGPKWRICEFSIASETTYDWFKERIKVVLFVSGGSIRFKISYTQVNFSVSGK